MDFIEFIEKYSKQDLYPYQKDMLKMLLDNKDRKIVIYNGRKR